MKTVSEQILDILQGSLWPLAYFWEDYSFELSRYDSEPILHKTPTPHKLKH